MTTMSRREEFYNLLSRYKQVSNTRLAERIDGQLNEIAILVSTVPSSRPHTCAVLDQLVARLRHDAECRRIMAAAELAEDSQILGADSQPILGAVAELAEDSQAMPAELADDSQVLGAAAELADESQPILGAVAELADDSQASPGPSKRPRRLEQFA